MKVFQNVLVKFGATWCNPCNQAEKFLSSKFQPTQYESIDVTENEDVAKQYGIKNVPTFILFDETGDIVERFTGFNPKQITDSIAKLA
ncbi:putative thioredoxin o [Acinetobacter phage vB_AbaM_Acibel004]|uniref:putative thioredoxin o n=1 Tax=Acinetobacter phage vB_AbaM_Acibel004 TaxID=1481186 RepID=UPI0004E858C0|nr:putative thioredoxin o [Acinetobacter phage vB_AbaM_Acibel004]AHY26731.1 putative thioredoxin o [Acinetobacter phage vB_AbaM_Acibel004]